jgi:hypothetical protein
VGSLVLYEILAHWPQYATHIPRRLASWLFTRPLEPPIRYESIGQVTDNQTFQALSGGRFFGHMVRSKQTLWLQRSNAAPVNNKPTFKNRFID